MDHDVDVDFDDIELLWSLSSHSNGIKCCF